MFTTSLPRNLSRTSLDSVRSASQKRGSEDEGKEEASPGLRSKISKTLQRSKQHNAASTEKNATAAGRFTDIFRSNTPPLPISRPATPPSIPQREQETQADGSNSNSFANFTTPVFEEPRKAPVPPKRPPRPHSELFVPPQGPSSPPKLGSSPPIPRKSPLRHHLNNAKPDQFSDLRPRPLFTSSASDADSAKGKGSPSLRSSSSKSSLSSQRSKSSPLPKASDAFTATLQQMKLKSRQDSTSTTSSQSTTNSAAPSLAARMMRSTTAPAAIFTLDHIASLSATKGTPSPSSKSIRTGSIKRRGTTRSLDSHLNKVADKSKAAQRVNAAADVRAKLLDLDDSWKRTKARPDAIAKPVKIDGPGDILAKIRKKRKGETMSMLLDAGFFPVEEFVYNEATNAPRRVTSKDFRINLPPRLSFLNGSLPSTPGSGQSTPTEMYFRSPVSPRFRSSYRRSSGLGRRPLSQISENEVNIDIGGIREEAEAVSPGRLEAIPEDATTSENTPPASRLATPVATQIHLRGGSVVTVTPPELTAWKPTIYLYGPIKLLKPAIMPRKGSVASLDPFQEVVDRVYQEALMIPRRRSDDAVVDDICEFFDDFGFDFVTFDGDKLAITASDVREVPEMSPDQERFSTPPLEPPAASPVEVVLAKEMVEHALQQQRYSNPPMIDIVVPPVNNEETLRARGIARLSRSSAGSSIELVSGRKESLTLGLGKRDSTAGLPLLPPPEESMLEAVLQPARTSLDGSIYGTSMHSSKMGNDGRSHAGSTQSNLSSHARSAHSSRRGVGSGSASGSQAPSRRLERDDVEEIDESSTWVAPVVPKKAGLSRGLSPMRSKNPVSKVRRLVATASTML